MKTWPLVSDKEGKFYKTTFQVGPYKGGKAQGSNRFIKKPSPVAGEKDRLYPEYLVYEQILPTNGVNGKIVSNNEWLQKNGRRDASSAEGMLGHMVAVLQVEELKDYVPPSTTFVGMDAHVLKTVFQTAMQEFVAALKKETK